ncbi:hypothetical protein ACP4OV_014578 [Aristida adscensionis]
MSIVLLSSSHLIQGCIATPSPADMASHHQRSTSLPSKPFSTEAKVEEELQILKACISSPCTTIDTMCDGLRMLGDIYSSIEEIMCLPSNQAAFSNMMQKETMEEELDRSVMLIDLCSAMQENLSELKMIVQELQLLLKRGDGVSAQLKVESFVRLAKKAQKSFKKTSNKAATSEGCRLIRLLAEAREMAVSLLESTCCLLPKQIATGKGIKWSLVSKRFQRRKVSCEEEQLQALERSMGDLENGAELLFRRLIQSRVSLLNILSS